MGVWIETALNGVPVIQDVVTPCVGVWIETKIRIGAELDIRSHPAWVCGLKHPCLIKCLCSSMSHPAWVCGLKLHSIYLEINITKVTPCVGVWIETVREPCEYRLASVTPCVGVWIETW